MQGGVTRNSRAHRSQRRGIPRDHSREQGPGSDRFLGVMVRTVPDGGASRGTNRAGSRRTRGRAEGGYRTVPTTCSTVQRPQHSQFRGVLARSASVPAGRPGRRSHHGELAYTGGMKKQKQNSLELRAIGVIRSKIKERSKAPKQGSEGAPDGWLEVHPFAAPALDGLAAGDELIVLTWLHLAHRNTLKVHPRSDPKRRLTGVFATRSPDRPNPIGPIKSRFAG